MQHYYKETLKQESFRSGNVLVTQPVSKRPVFLMVLPSLVRHIFSETTESNNKISNAF